MASGCYYAKGAPFQEAAPATDDLATVYVYREKSFVGSADWDIPTLYVNGTEVGRLNLGGYVVLRLQPGDYEFTVKKSSTGLGKQDRVSGQHALKVSRNRDYYLKYLADIQGIYLIGNAAYTTFSVNFQLMESWRAKKELADTKRIETKPTIRITPVEHSKPAS